MRQPHLLAVAAAWQAAAFQSSVPHRRRLRPVLATEVDVAVVGAGPAGSVLAWRLAHQEGLSVGLVDPALSRPWVNNYGVWVDEWSTLAAELEGLELESCLDARWEKTDCYFGGSRGSPLDERTRLARGYGRVARERLRSRLRADAKVRQIEGKIEARASLSAPNVFDRANVAHDADGTTLRLSTGETVRARVVVDCTGFESRLTTRGATPEPGYQIAYGFEAEVAGLGPYDPDAMVLFDYRTDHLEDEAASPPTFMYAMPLDNGRCFFEETVLVSKPAMSVAECERRCLRRLDHLGIRLTGPRTDVELCYIPMGGPIPDPGQRLVAFGAAAGLVHPATGYHLCRALKASGDLARALGTALRADASPDHAAAAAYAALWPKRTASQRDFTVFGGDFLLTLDAADLRAWFTAFFALPTDMWAGFLAFWPGFTGNHHHESRLGRLAFGLAMVYYLPPDLALKLLAFIVSFSLTQGPSLLQTVVPFFGDGRSFAPPSPRPDHLGDLPVKAEIRARLQAQDDPDPARPDLSSLQL